MAYPLFPQTPMILPYLLQVAEKRPSAAFPSSFPVSSTGQAYCGVLPSTPLADSPTRRRGKMSLLIRRDATLKISGALHLTIFEQPEKDDFSSSLSRLVFLSLRSSSSRASWSFCFPLPYPDHPEPITQMVQEFHDRINSGIGSPFQRTVETGTIHPQFDRYPPDRGLFFD
jgi:hypothetical protein